MMVQVKIVDGILEGEQFENEYGGTIYSFKGIPYAKPPIGDLRFKAPVRIKPWVGVREAKNFGPTCPQYNFFNKKQQSGNEDCLYLNVYSPDLTPSKTLPVMLWIHGGGFVCGSGDIYDPEFLIRHNVLLVTINYRLEALGFLSLLSEDIPGNAGMKDQVEAMRWVQRNISYFGGDPKKVTIFGESAGGACISYHLVSPMTKGLFSRAIIQSGSCFNFWTQSTMPRERAIALARNLGLESESDKELYEFFKAQPVELLVNAQVPLTYYEANKVGNEVWYSVVSEKYFPNSETFFHGDVFETALAGIHEGVEILNGYTEHEGTLMLINKDIHEKIFEQANLFPEFYLPKSLLMKCTMPQIIEVGRKVKKFYFKNEKVSLDNISQLIKFYTMNMFAFGIILWQNICASTGQNPMYLYKFTCKSERKVTKTEDALGSMQFTSHADDLAYLFPLKRRNQQINTDFKSLNMIDNITILWTNFAKYGDPTPDDSLGVKWLPYTVENKSYMDIGEHLVLKENPDNEDMEFWMDIFKEFYSLTDKKT